MSEDLATQTNKPRTSNYALRLQATLKEEAERAAKAEGTTLNQLINVAVAEKLAALRTAGQVRAFLAKADHDVAMDVLTRRTDAPLPEGDELPEGFSDDGPHAQ